MVHLCTLKIIFIKTTYTVTLKSYFLFFKVVRIWSNIGFGDITYNIQRFNRNFTILLYTKKQELLLILFIN